MSRLPSFPTIDLTSFDLGKLRSLELPTFGLPAVEFGDIDEKVVATVKNAAYLTVGVGVAAVERLDRARRTATSVASDAIDSLGTAVSGAVERVGKLVS